MYRRASRDTSAITRNGVVYLPNDTAFAFAFRRPFISRRYLKENFAAGDPARRRAGIALLWNLPFPRESRLDARGLEKEKEIREKNVDGGQAGMRMSRLRLVFTNSRYSPANRSFIDHSN